MISFILNIISLVSFASTSEVPPCQYNPFPLILGGNTTITKVRHLDYRAADEILVAAGKLGYYTGMSLFSPSTSGNNLGLLEFKWEMLITTPGWSACGIKIAQSPSNFAVLLACDSMDQVITFVYIDLYKRKVESHYSSYF